MPSADSPSASPAAVLFLTFNRPDLFERLTAAVALAGPRKVFVAIDGPRASRPQDAILCEEMRRLAESLTWPTEVQIKAEPQNLGCGPAVVGAIGWALEQVEEVIILEDDCLPDPSFLFFCDELLARYRHDERVMQISGNNWGASADRYNGYSYAFNAFAPIWGWATWRRAWQHYEFRMESWPRIKAQGALDGMALSSRFRKIMHYEWDQVYAGKGTWDHQWQYAVLRNTGLSISPSQNLVVNLGFRADATNYTEVDRVFSFLPVGRMEFPLRHPPEVIRSAAVEALFEKIYWQKLGWPVRLYRRLLRHEGTRKVLRGLMRKLRARPI